MRGNTGSYRPSGRARRAAAAVVAGIALPLLVAGWSVNAANLPGDLTPPIVLPSPSAAVPSLTGVLPSPSAAVPSLTGVLPSPVGVPSVPAVPTPTAAGGVPPALPVALPTGSPVPSPATQGVLPAPCSSAPPTVAAVSAPATPCAVSTVIPVAGTPTVGALPLTLGGGTSTLGVVTGLTPIGTAAGATPAPIGAGGAGGALSATDASAAALNSMLGLLGTPANVGVERPNLRHFGALTSAATETVGHLQAATPDGALFHLLLPAWLWTLLLAGMGGAGAIALVSMYAGRHPLYVKAVEYTAIPVAVVLVLASIGPRSGADGLHRAPTGVAAAVAAALAVHPAAVTAHTVPTTGQALLAQVTVLENHLAAQETAVALSSARLRDAAAVPDSTVVELASARQSAGRASDQAHVLEATLQQEYDFFASVARSAERATALVQAAATTPPATHDAIVYDVQVVQAQLAQQMVIDQVGLVTANAGGIAPAQLSSPEAGAITQGFGPSSLAFEPALRFDGTLYPHFHTGIDIAAPFDSPVQAAAEGVVALAGSELDSSGNLVGYGRYVVIAHGGGMVTLYAHLDQLLVQPGQAVHGGDVIGLEGTSGNSTGPHLHFEVRVGGLLVDPMQYLTAQ